MKFSNMHPGQLSKLVKEENGKLFPRIVPAQEILKLGDFNRQILMTQLGLYVWPTQELVEFFKKNINDKTPVLELGAGNGVLGKTLGWNSTDNFSQSTQFNARNEIEKQYNAMALMQLKNNNIAPVNYGSNVINLNAHDAIREYKASAIVGLYLTDITQNEFTINLVDALLYANTEMFYLVGNMDTHHNKSPIFEYKHEAIELEGLVVRHQKNELGRIFKWDKNDLLN